MKMFYKFKSATIMFAIKVYKESQWPSFNSGSKKMHFWTSDA